MYKTVASLFIFFYYCYHLASNKQFQLFLVEEGPMETGIITGGNLDFILRASSTSYHLCLPMCLLPIRQKFRKQFLIRFYCIINALKYLLSKHFLVN